MARIDISRELEVIAEAKRRKEYEALERRRQIFEQARAAVTERIAQIEKSVRAQDAYAWLELNDWRMMGKDGHAVTWWANLEILHTERAFTCKMVDTIQITAAVYIMRHAGGTPQELNKLGFTIPDVSNGY